MKRSGRYCWSCGGRRPNERFSRRSGLRGVCRDCYRLGPAELAYRQVERNIDSALRCSDFIPRRHRKMIEGFLAHQDPRIRAYAAEIIARDAAARREQAAWFEEEERMYAGLHEPPAGPAAQAAPVLDDRERSEAEERDLPF